MASKAAVGILESFTNIIIFLYCVHVLGFCSWTCDIFCFSGEQAWSVQQRG